MQKPDTMNRGKHPLHYGIVAGGGGSGSGASPFPAPLLSRLSSDVFALKI